MRRPVCPQCGSRQQVPDQAGYYRCEQCSTVSYFVDCVCGSLEFVPEPAPGRPPKAFTCSSCGERHKIQWDSVAGGRLERFGQGLENVGRSMQDVGKAIQGFVWTLILLGIIWLFYQCALGAVE